MTSKTEIWKNILGYENKYAISTLGNVKNIKYDRLLKPTADCKGYLNVKLYTDGFHSKVYKVHRLVAEAFIPNLTNLPQINHKDENKTNNCVDNLEWCNNKYNCNYGSHSKHLSKQIQQFNKDGDYIRDWDGISEAGRALNVCIQSIQKCCKLKRPSAGGYVWRYKEGY